MFFKAKALSPLFPSNENKEEIQTELIQVLAKYKVSFRDALAIFNNTLMELQEFPIDYQNESKS